MSKDTSDSVVKVGDKVRFMPNWRSTEPVTAKVVEIDGQFAVTVDSTDRKRRMRLGACTVIG